MVYDYTAVFFCHSFLKETTLVTSCLLQWLMNPYIQRSTLKVKNLLLKEQILSLKSRLPLIRAAKMQVEELLPLKANAET